MNVLSICSGVGGIDVATKQLGFTTVAYVEYDPYCQAVLQARMRDGRLDRAPIWSDLRTFNGLAWRGSVEWFELFAIRVRTALGRRKSQRFRR